MKQLTLPALLISALAVSGPVAASSTVATADMHNREGQSIGKATLRETPSGVLLDVRLKDLPPGVHAFHIHETGKCEPPFTSAGGHFAPKGAEHGFLNPKGAHEGDMPNIHVPESGELEMEVMTNVPSLSKELLDADGAALVIHEGPDDYKTNPAGAAGKRIACGVLKSS